MQDKRKLANLILDSILKEITYYRSSKRDPIINLIRFNIASFTENGIQDVAAPKFLEFMIPSYYSYLTSEDITLLDNQLVTLNAFHTLLGGIFTATYLHAINPAYEPSHRPYDYRNSVFNTYTRNVNMAFYGYQYVTKTLFESRIHNKRAIKALKEVLKPDYRLVLGNFFVPPYNHSVRHKAYWDLSAHNQDNGTQLSLEEYNNAST
jgi:hypothetical protein